MERGDRSPSIVSSTAEEWQQAHCEVSNLMQLRPIDHPCPNCLSRNATKEDPGKDLDSDDDRGEIDREYLKSFKELCERQDAAFSAQRKLADRANSKGDRSEAVEQCERQEAWLFDKKAEWVKINHGRSVTLRECERQETAFSGKKAVFKVYLKRAEAYKKSRKQKEALLTAFKIEYNRMQAEHPHAKAESAAQEAASIADTDWVPGAETYISITVNHCQNARLFKLQDHCTPQALCDAIHDAVEKLRVDRFAISTSEASVKYPFWLDQWLDFSIGLPNKDDFDFLMKRVDLYGGPKGNCVVQIDVTVTDVSDNPRFWKTAPKEETLTEQGSESE
ncbi:MAG: hypothetical protein M1836_007943 [Candelina mexicana]|nr:MAG: hypothetical protein M1836_007943 [Candelina mexicana]